MKAWLVVASLVAAAPITAQSNEVTLLGGRATSGGIDRTAPTIDALEIASAFTWGIAARHSFNSHICAEASWARRESALALEQGSSRARLFDLNQDQLLGSFVYRFGHESAHLRPYLSAGLGAMFFSAEDQDSETKLSAALGGGLQWLPSKRWGTRLQASYTPTYLNDKSSGYCDPFGFCQQWLHQFELTAGVSFRF